MAITKKQINKKENEFLGEVDELMCLIDNPKNSEESIQRQLGVCKFKYDELVELQKEYLNKK